jgi:hypothetical protein
MIILNNTIGTYEYYAQKLREHVTDGNIDWDEYTLQKDMMVYEISFQLN